MSYLLSIQLATTLLNEYYGVPTPESGSSLLIAGTPPNACGGAVVVTAGGAITVNSLVSEALTELQANANPAPGTNAQICEQFKQATLNNANNNLNFVQSNQNSCPAFSFDTSSCTF
jgi:hypothetical protein